MGDIQQCYIPVQSEGTERISHGNENSKFSDHNVQGKGGIFGKGGYSSCYTNGSFKKISLYFAVLLFLRVKLWSLS